MTFLRKLRLGITLTASLCLVSCSPGPAAKEAETPGTEAEATPTPATRERTYLTSVFTRVIERGEIRATIATTGSIIPGRSVSVKVEESGRLRFEKPWLQGDLVEAGTVLARIESPSLQREKELREADIEIQRENLDIGQRTLENRVRDYQSLQDLYSRGISALREVDSARLELDRSRNSQRQNMINLARAEASLRELDDRFAALEIQAPFSGLLVSRATLEGQGKFQRGFGQEAITDYDGLNVSVGHVVCGVVERERVLMRCDITSKDVASLSIGQDADVVIYARGDAKLSGKVFSISSNVNPDTRAFDVDILLDNTDGLLKPGMFGRAEIVTEARRDVIAVPRSVVSRRGNRDVVFVVEKPADAPYDVARMVPVDLGLEGREDIEIAFGLRSGDRIIVRGFEVLQDATPIRAIDADAPITASELSTTVIEAEDPEEGADSEDAPGEAANGEEGVEPPAASPTPAAEATEASTEEAPKQEAPAAEPEKTE